jgi:membrane associated rhomboid family serine protease
MANHRTILCGFLITLLYLVSASVALRMPNVGIGVVRRVNHSVKRTDAIRGVEASNLGLLRSRLSSDSASVVLPRPTVTNIMLATNVFAFLAAAVLPGLQHAIMKIDHRIIRGESYRLLSSLFAHGGLSHLAMNCLSLRNVGPQVLHVSLITYRLLLFTTIRETSSNLPG